jgi:hypothetical protein
VLPPKRTWTETALLAGHEVLLWLKQHPLISAAIVLMVVVAGLLRRDLANLWCTLVWQAFRWHSARRQLLATIWLLERRATLAGRPRPPHATLAGWYLPLAHRSSAEIDLAFRELLQEAATVLYAPPESVLAKTSNAEHLAHVCCQAARELTLRKLRRILVDKPSPHSLSPAQHPA